MKKLDITPTNELHIKNIKGFFEKRVTKFGTGAKIDCPKEYLGDRVYVVVCRDR
ncbi:MAG: DUF2080 family transposase-associated protein [Candidatus Thermoplasmatota archaeon]|nr:DUF2080 family transposase-associated protein [Candidatus Thermoplasmatota archaeon]